MIKMYAAVAALCLVAFSSKAQFVVFGDDYAPNVAFVPFGGSVNNLSVDNSQSQSGTASLKINVGTTGYTGGAMVIGAPTNLSTYTALTFWAKSDNPAYKLNVMGLGNNGAAGTTFEVERTAVDLTSAWVKYYIPIPAPSKLTAEVGLFHFAEGAEANAYNIWIDNLQYENVSSAILGTPTAAIATETITKAIGETFKPNGASANYPVCAEGQMKIGNAYLNWTSSNTSAATMDALGMGTAVAQGTTNITAKLGTTDAAGTLTVNVTPSLNVPTVAANTPPARPAADVISIFSGAYADLTATDFNPNWGQSTLVSEVEIAGNPTKRYNNFNYQGMQFAAPINASQMTRLHIDVWTPNCTDFKVFPIVPGQPEQSVSITPTLNGWTSTDIDLSQYTIPLNNVIQIKLQAEPFGSSTVYWDNLYFHKNTLTSVEPLTGVKSLRAFPNPANQELSLSFSSPAIAKANFSVLNLAGQVLKKGQISDLEKAGSISLSISDLESGMYMLKVEDQDASHTIRFVKN